MHFMYSAEETLRISVPRYVQSPLHDETRLSCFDGFLDDSRKTHIKQLIIEQEAYLGYRHYHGYERTYSGPCSIVTIPDTIAILTELETICITAHIETLPKRLCTMKKLKLLDLTGCYNILSIPSEILSLPNLKIQIGSVLSPASEVLVIGVPKRGISMDIFSLLSGGNNRKISQLIIHQDTHAGYADSYSDKKQGPLEDYREELVIPDNISIREGIRSLHICGKLLTIPNWLFKQKTLNSLGLSGYFDKLPGELGELTQLNSLDLSGCYNLDSLPESIGNLSKLTSLNLSLCENLGSLPESIENLHELVSVNLRQCRNLRSVPERIQSLTQISSPESKDALCDLKSSPSSSYRHAPNSEYHHKSLLLRHLLTDEDLKTLAQSMVESDDTFMQGLDSLLHATSIARSNDLFIPFLLRLLSNVIQTVLFYVSSSTNITLVTRAVYFLQTLLEQKTDIPPLISFSLKDLKVTSKTLMILLMVRNLPQMHATPFSNPHKHGSGQIVNSVVDVLHHLAASEHLTQDIAPPVEYEIETLTLFTSHPSLSYIRTDFASYATFLIDSCFPQRDFHRQTMDSRIDLLLKPVYRLINPNPSLHWKGLCEYICHLTTGCSGRKNTLHLSDSFARVTLFNILQRLQEWVDDLHVQLDHCHISANMSDFLQPPFLPSSRPINPFLQWRMGEMQQNTDTSAALSEEEKNRLRRTAEMHFTEADMGEVVLMDRSHDKIITPIANTLCRIPAHPGFDLHSNIIQFYTPPPGGDSSLLFHQEGYVILDPVLSHGVHKLTLKLLSNANYSIGAYLYSPSPHIHRHSLSRITVPSPRHHFRADQTGSIEKGSLIDVELDLRHGRQVLYVYADGEPLTSLDIHNEEGKGFKFCFTGDCSSPEPPTVEVVSLEDTSSSLEGDLSLFFSFCKNGNSDSALLSQLLKNNHLDINHRYTSWARGVEPTESTGLMVACQNGHADIVSLLLERPDLNINLITLDGKTALDMSTDPAIVEMLKQHGAVEGPKVTLTQAIQEQKLEAVQLILSHAGGNFSLPRRYRGYEQEEPSYVETALKVGSVPILECLLNHGMKVDLSSLDTLSIDPPPRFFSMIRCIAEHDVDITPLLEHGTTLLHQSAWMGDVNLVKKEISRGGDVNCVDEFGRTPIFIAAANGHVNVIEFLHSHHGDLNRKDKKGRTPLFIASRNGKTESVEFIITHQPDIDNIDGANEDGQTPLFIASSAGNVETVKCLVEHGAEITRECRGGGCALHAASMNGHLSVVQFLVERGGVDINARTEAGMTPLDLAVLNGQRDVMEYITQHGGKEGNAIETMINGTAPITKVDALTSLFIHNSNPASIHQEGNILRYTGCNGGNETVVIGDPMRDGIHRLNMRILSRGWYCDHYDTFTIPSNLNMVWLNQGSPMSQPLTEEETEFPEYDPDHTDHDWTETSVHPIFSSGLISSEFGVFDSSFDCPHSGDAIVKDGRGVRYRPYYRYVDYSQETERDDYIDGDDGGGIYYPPNLMNANGTPVGFNDIASDGDVISLELDLRSPTPSQRTLHFFVNGKQQPFFFFGLPRSVRFITGFFLPGESIEFLSLLSLHSPTSSPLFLSSGTPFILPPPYRYPYRYRFSFPPYTSQFVTPSTDLLDKFEDPSTHTTHTLWINLRGGRRIPFSFSDHQLLSDFNTAQPPPPPLPQHLPPPLPPNPRGDDEQTDRLKSLIHPLVTLTTGIPSEQQTFYVGGGEFTYRHITESRNPSVYRGIPRIDVDTAKTVTLTLIDGDGKPTLTITACTNELVQTVKERIEQALSKPSSFPREVYPANLLGTPPDRHSYFVLVCNGRYLRQDYFRLSHYGIEDDAQIQLRVSTPISLSINTPTGDTQIQLHTEDFIYVLKRHIFYQFLQVPESVLLTYNGTVLNDSETLSHYGIPDNASLSLSGYSVLTLTIQLPDGRTLTVTANSYDYVDTLKHNIALLDSSLLSKSNQIALHYGSVKLEDGYSKRLSFYNINSGDVLKLSFS